MGKSKKKVNEKWKSQKKSECKNEREEKQWLKTGKEILRQIYNKQVRLGNLKKKKLNK